MTNKRVKKNKKMDVIFLIDRSGSMYNLTDETIGGYNGYLDSLKGKDVNITTVLFNTYCEILEERTPLDKASYLDGKYHAMGGTALYDAIGKTIERIDKKNPDKVLFIINTDGYENSSIMYDSRDVKRLIKKHDKWEFIFLGADIDTIAETSKIGIDSSRSIKYSKTTGSQKKLYGSLSDISNNYFVQDKFDDKWLEKLNDNELNETNNDEKTYKFGLLNNFIKKNKKDK